MKEKVINFLKENKDISAYSVIFSDVTSKEAFFIKDKCDMNRAKDVFNVVAEIYKDFEENGKKYRGSAKIKIFPQDSNDVIKKKIEEAVFAARFVKNEWYPLPTPSDKIDEELKLDVPMQSLLKMQKCVYSEKVENANINSAEFFATNSIIEIVNSEGIDVKFGEQENEVEVITDSSAGGEEVEIYGSAIQGVVCEEALKTLVKEQLQNTAERASAKKTSHIPSINVILRGDSVEKFFGFYGVQTASYFVYGGQSSAKIGEALQKEIKGDAVSITLEPTMKGSPYCRKYDRTGFKLEKTVLFEKGVVKTYHGGTRFAHYLGIKPTGDIANVSVMTGSRSYEKDMKNAPYVEILMFSDFFMDPVTGNFGGEFRLARWFDGKETHIITGGSISGNVFKVQNEMYFSKEEMQRGGYKGPKAILLPNMEIVG